MLKPAILALIRQILTIVGTALVAKGYIQASDVEPVIGALLTIGSVICGLVTYLCRSKCSFRPPGVRRPMGFSLPMLNADGVGYRNR